jgi:membrane-bound lytic murein transglycosylase B
LFAASGTDAERAQLQAQLDALEKQISQYETTVGQYQKQGASLQGEIKILNNKIASLNLQIKTITLNLQRLNGEIINTQNQVTQTENTIGQTKQSLTGVLQTLYENESQSMLETIIANPRLSDFFSDVNNLLVLQDSVRSALEKIVALRTSLINQKESLSLQFNDVSQLKAYQESQKQAIAQTQLQKNQILQVTKGQESKYQQLLAQTKQTAAQIRSRLYELLGGGQLAFGDAYNLAKTAQDATGVRAALILAVLDRESALGKNVGKCKYDVNPYYPNKASNATAMHPTRDVPIFLQICQALNIDPHSVSVSCPIPSDGAYGGAMGPAQFIPSTWQKYSAQIASATGHANPSPWNNLDAFMATALYMRDAGAANGTVYDEKVAAAKYYAGSRWQYYISTYGAAVIDRAQSFQDDIDVLTSNGH